MNIKSPEPFIFNGGKRAVLLLHGFTGHSADMRMLGRFLEKNGYTAYGPIYRGHGKTPEDLLSCNASDWMDDVRASYEKIKKDGFEKIAAVGLSLGGLLSLYLASEFELVGIGALCSPLFFDEGTDLLAGFKYYASLYKQKEGKTTTQINNEVKSLLLQSTPLFDSIESFIKKINASLKDIETDTLIIQEKYDQIINPHSATVMYNNIKARNKSLIWYENASHAITLGNKRDLVNKDILDFLNTLNWSE